MPDEGRGSRDRASESGGVRGRGRDDDRNRSQETPECRERLRAVNSSGARAAGRLTASSEELQTSSGYFLEGRSDVGGEDLQRDTPVELRVARPVDLAHPARAERREDLVGAETSADSDCHDGNEFLSVGAASPNAGPAGQ